MVVDLDGETPVLRQAFLRDVEAAHQLQSRDQRVRDAASIEHVLLQYAVDALSNAQHFLVRLDVDVGRVDLHGVLEYRLQQLDDRRFGRVLLGLELV